MDDHHVGERRHHEREERVRKPRDEARGEAERARRGAEESRHPGGPAPGAGRGSTRRPAPAGRAPPARSPPPARPSKRPGSYGTSGRGIRPANASTIQRDERRQGDERPLRRPAERERASCRRRLRAGKRQGDRAGPVARAAPGRAGRWSSPGSCCRRGARRTPGPRPPVPGPRRAPRPAPATVAPKRSTRIRRELLVARLRRGAAGTSPAPLIATASTPSSSSAACAPAAAGSASRAIWPSAPSSPAPACARVARVSSAVRISDWEGARGRPSWSRGVAPSGSANPGCEITTTASTSVRVGQARRSSRGRPPPRRWRRRSSRGSAVRSRAATPRLRGELQEDAGRRGARGAPRSPTA